MNISDKNITTLLESRNEQALKLLSEKYGGLCSSISYNVLGNRSDSEEVTNDTYMKVWNTIPPEKPRSLCAYVAKIVLLHQQIKMLKDHCNLLSLFAKLSAFQSR